MKSERLTTYVKYVKAVASGKVLRPPKVQGYFFVDHREWEVHLAKELKGIVKEKLFVELTEKTSSVRYKQRVVKFKLPGSGSNRWAFVAACRLAMIEDFDIRVFLGSLQNDTFEYLLKPHSWWSELENACGKRSLHKVLVPADQVIPQKCKLDLTILDKVPKVVPRTPKVKPVSFWNEAVGDEKARKLKEEVLSIMASQAKGRFVLDSDFLVLNRPFGSVRTQLYITSARIGVSSPEIRYDKLDKVFRTTPLFHTHAAWHFSLRDGSFGEKPVEVSAPKMAKRAIEIAMVKLEQFSNSYGKLSDIWKPTLTGLPTPELRCRESWSVFMAMAVLMNDKDAVERAYAACRQEKMWDFLLGHLSNVYWRVLEQYPHFRQNSILNSEDFNIRMRKRVEFAEKTPFPDMNKGKVTARGVFLSGEELQGADPVSWRHIAGPYTADAEHVFWHFKAIRGADPVSFQPIQNSSPSSLARDEKMFFSNQDIITKSQFEIAYSVPYPEGLRRAGIQP